MAWLIHIPICILYYLQVERKYSEVKARQLAQHEDTLNTDDFITFKTERKSIIEQKKIKIEGRYKQVENTVRDPVFIMEKS